MKVTILGCGSSTGTPGMGIGWGKCDPANPKNRRTRPSIMVEEGETRVLIDTSPDLREQAIRAGIDRLDAVVYTHDHADHLHGIDDLRPFNRSMNRSLDVYGDAKTLGTIRQRFPYVVTPLPPDATIYYKPVLVPREIRAGEPFRIGALEFRPFLQEHGHARTLGFRIGDFAYSTDLIELPEAGFAAVAGVRTWVLGVFADHPHPTHVHVEKALGWIERVKPERTIITHMSPALDYATLSGSLPKGVEPAYDGMVIEA